MVDLPEPDELQDESADTDDPTQPPPSGEELQEVFQNAIEAADAAMEQQPGTGDTRALLATTSGESNPWEAATVSPSAIPASKWLQEQGVQPAAPPPRPTREFVPNNPELPAEGGPVVDQARARIAGLDETKTHEQRVDRLLNDPENGYDAAAAVYNGTILKDSLPPREQVKAFLLTSMSPSQKTVFEKRDPIRTPKIVLEPLVPTKILLKELYWDRYRQDSDTEEGKILSHRDESLAVHALDEGMIDWRVGIVDATRESVLPKIKEPSHEDPRISQLPITGFQEDYGNQGIRILEIGPGLILLREDSLLTDKERFPEGEDFPPLIVTAIDRGDGTETILALDRLDKWDGTEELSYFEVTPETVIRNPIVRGQMMWTMPSTD